MLFRSFPDWTVHAIDTDDYVFLGDHFQSGKTDGEDKPDLRRGQLPSLRAVRKDLCVKATISEKPVRLYYDHARDILFKKIFL